MSAAWIDRSLAEIMQGLRSGGVTASGLFEEGMERHAGAGSVLQAYRVWDPERGEALAREADGAFRAGRDLGPLQGIPVSVKDLYGLEGFDIHAGTSRALPARWRREGPLIGLLRSQAAVMAGKTHMVEFAFGAVGMNSHWPVPRNPWDLTHHRVPGGSSSGAGVSLMEGSA
ncbi:MAG: amidase family protein, partial [Hyphomicrobiales bacterium]